MSCRTLQAEVRAHPSEQADRQRDLLIQLRGPAGAATVCAERLRIIPNGAFRCEGRVVGRSLPESSWSDAGSNGYPTS